MKLSDVLDVKDLGDAGYLLKLKPDHPRTDLLNFKGFGLQYDAFKLWDLNKGTAYLMFLDTENNSTWTVSWGHSTTMTSEHVWEMQMELLACICKKFPKVRDCYRVPGILKKEGA